MAGTERMNSMNGVMTHDEFRLFRDLIHEECGIFLKDAKKDFLNARIEKRLKSLEFGSYFHYYKYVKHDTNRRELCALLDSITINETSFFRNMPQFEILGEKVIPEIVARKRRSGDYNLVFWSAGCSTGEEPYSIAIETLESVPDSYLWNIQVIASDISLRCLEVAQNAVYPKAGLKYIPQEYIDKYLRCEGDVFTVKDELKRYVIFDYHNLKHENGINSVDVIFCRNVMIYYDSEEQKRIINRFSQILNPGGYLFLGHAESLQSLGGRDFRFVYSNKGTAYQKTENKLQ